MGTYHRRVVLVQRRRAVDRRARVTLKAGGWKTAASGRSLEAMSKPQDKAAGDGGAAKDAPAKPAGTPGETKPGKPATTPAKEIGGRGGLDPTRYGDWEKNGRAIDF